MRPHCKAETKVFLHTLGQENKYAVCSDLVWKILHCVHSCREPVPDFLWGQLPTQVHRDTEKRAVIASKQGQRHSRVCLKVMLPVVENLYCASCRSEGNSSRYQERCPWPRAFIACNVWHSNFWQKEITSLVNMNSQRAVSGLHFTQGVCGWW